MVQCNAKRSPDETDMACALYLRGLADDRSGAEILSAATGRTFSSAHLKLQNFKAVDPEYTACGRVGVSNGGAEVIRGWKRFEDGGMPLIEKFLSMIYGKAKENDPLKLEFPGSLAPGTDHAVIGTKKVGQKELRNLALFYAGHRCCIAGDSMPTTIHEITPPAILEAEVMKHPHSETILATWQFELMTIAMYWLLDILLTVYLPSSFFPSVSSLQLSRRRISGSVMRTMEQPPPFASPMH